MLEDEVPVLTVTFSTQEVLLFRNALTREIIVGAEDKVEQCMYGAVLTRVEADVANPTTGGWKIIEVSSVLSRSQHKLNPTDPIRWFGGRPRVIFKSTYSRAILMGY